MSSELEKNFSGKKLFNDFSSCHPLLTDACVCVCVCVCVLQVGDLLGIGAFAEVRKAIWRRTVAVKRFKNVRTQEQLDAFAREVCL